METPGDRSSKAQKGMSPVGTVRSLRSAQHCCRHQAASRTSSVDSGVSHFRNGQTCIEPIRAFESQDPQPRLRFPGARSQEMLLELGEQTRAEQRSRFYSGQRRNLAGACHSRRL